MTVSGVVTITCCLIVGLVAGSTRFYIRVIKAGEKNQAEWISFGVMIMMTIMLVVQYFLNHFLADVLQNWSNPDPGTYITLMKLYGVNTCMYITVLWGTKLSINLLHIKLTARLKFAAYLAKASFYFIMVGYPICILVVIFQCLPMERRWAVPGLPDQLELCPSLRDSFDVWVNAALNIFSELLLMIAPFPALAKITDCHLRRAVYAVYGLAIVTVFASIMRVVYMSADMKLTIERSMIASLLEMTIAYVISVLPGISSSFTKWVVRNSRPTRYSRTYGASGTVRSVVSAINVETKTSLGGNSTGDGDTTKKGTELAIIVSVETPLDAVSENLDSDARRTEEWERV